MSIQRQQSSLVNAGLAGSNLFFPVLGALLSILAEYIRDPHRSNKQSRTKQRVWPSKSKKHLYAASSAFVPSAGYAALVGFQPEWIDFNVGFSPLEDVTGVAKIDQWVLLYLAVVVLPAIIFRGVIYTSLARNGESSGDFGVDLAAERSVIKVLKEELEKLSGKEGATQLGSQIFQRQAMLDKQDFLKVTPSKLRFAFCGLGEETAVSAPQPSQTPALGKK